MAKLVLTSGPSGPREWKLPEGETSVGRQEGNEIMLEDPRISRRHFSVFLSGGRVYLVNHSRTHGTLVNGMLAEGN